MTTYTETPPALWRFQCDPAADGTNSVQAFFRSEIVNDENPADKITKDAGAVWFTLPPALAAQIATLAEAARTAV